MTNEEKLADLYISPEEIDQFNFLVSHMPEELVKQICNLIEQDIQETPKGEH